MPSTRGERDRQVTQQVACPACQAPRGRPCYYVEGRPVIHSERRLEWAEKRPTVAPDITMRHMAEGPIGQRNEWIRLTPKTARGRAAIWPDMADAPQRVEHQDITRRLAELRSHGLVVMREDDPTSR